MLKVQIPAENSAYIERLHYEMLGLRNLLTHMERSKTPDDRFCRTMRDYKQVFTEYSLAVEQMGLEYIPVEYRTKDNKFKLEYNSCILYIGKAEEIDGLA